MNTWNESNDGSIKIFIDECNELIELAIEDALQMEKGSAQEDVFQRFYRTMHTIKGSSALYGFRELSLIVHEIESHFEVLRCQPRKLTRVETDAMLEAIDAISLMVDAIQRKDQAAYNEISVQFGRAARLKEAC